MGHVRERVRVNCPYAKARDLLRAIVQDAILCGEAQSVRLSLSAADRTLIERRVLLRYAPGDDPLRFHERWNVTWTPQDGGPYPDFSGELAVSIDEAAGTVVELEGSYDAPFGAVGAAFDVIAGSRIAASSARSFLKDLVARIEARNAGSSGVS